MHQLWSALCSSQLMWHRILHYWFFFFWLVLFGYERSSLVTSEVLLFLEVLNTKPLQRMPTITNNLPEQQQQRHQHRRRGKNKPTCWLEVDAIAKPWWPQGRLEIYFALMMLVNGIQLASSAVPSRLHIDDIHLLDRSINGCDEQKTSTSSVGGQANEGARHRERAWL